MEDIRKFNRHNLTITYNRYDGFLDTTDKDGLSLRYAQKVSLISTHHHTFSLQSFGQKSLSIHKASCTLGYVA